MWVVGILRYGEFHLLRDSPGFREALEAKTWAQDYLKANPRTLMPGVDCITWRLVKEAVMH